MDIPCRGRRPFSLHVLLRKLTSSLHSMTLVIAYKILFCYVKALFSSTSRIVIFNSFYLVIVDISTTIFINKRLVQQEYYAFYFLLLSLHDTTVVPILLNYNIISLPNVEENLPPRSANSSRALFNTIHKTIVIMRHRSRFRKKSRWWPLGNQKTS